MYLRIGLEPYVVRRWHTYPAQFIFSAVLIIYGLCFVWRIFLTLGAVDCSLGGFGPITRFILISATGFLPLLTFSLLSMTSGRVERELRETRDALQLQAETDSLTGLSNRRHFLDIAGRAVERARTAGGVVSLLMLDVDHFKIVNDTRGHQFGDSVLRETGRCLEGALRPLDRVGRLGGEEFGVLLPGVEGAMALQVADRLRQAVAVLQPEGYPLTISLGVATGNDSVDALLARADAGLYAAKRAGRNRVGCVDARACPGSASEVPEPPARS